MFLLHTMCTYHLLNFICIKLFIIAFYELKRTLVRLGEWDVSINDNIVQDIKVIGKAAHPNYDNNNLQNDIAILYLNRRARLSGKLKSNGNSEECSEIQVFIPLKSDCDLKMFQITYFQFVCQQLKLFHVKIQLFMILMLLAGVY